MKPVLWPRLFAALMLLSLSGCDWIQYAFMNSIPFHGDPAKNPDVHVYLAVDGLAHSTVSEARKQGAFPEPQWSLARSVTMFPGTSDASWTRIMHTHRIGGYEIEYYDPTQDQIKNPGLVGLARHVTPSIADFINFESPYLKSYDFQANGYTHSLEAYRDTFLSFADTLDNLFLMIEGRAETTAVFSAYVLEFDVLGHMQKREDVTHALLQLHQRIIRFKQKHPERNFHFTLVSDHGMDFLPVPSKNLVMMDDELPKVGIQPVTHLGGYDPEKELFAIPILHTRVTYVALHTHRSIVEEVARRASQLESVDLAVAKIQKPELIPDPSSADEWYGIWADGKLALAYGFDSKTNHYVLPIEGDYARLNIPVLFEKNQKSRTFSDTDLFLLMRDRTYPDLFFRARTSLAPISIEYPGDVLLSFRPGFVSKGFQLPGSDDIATSSFHGSLQTLGSDGIMLTDEFEGKTGLPAALRSDSFLEIFPRMREHLQARKVEYVEGDRNSLIDLF